MNAEEIAELCQFLRSTYPGADPAAPPERKPVAPRPNGFTPPPLRFDWEPEPEPSEPADRLLETVVTVAQAEVSFGWHVPDAELRARLERLAAERKKESDRRKDVKKWGPDRQIIGALAEWTFAVECGIAMVWDPKILDGGLDLGTTNVDVKGNKWWRDPWLRRLVEHPLRAPLYACVAIDLQAFRGKYVGFATREQLRAAEVHDFGYGPTRIIRPAGLARYLPVVRLAS